MKLSVVLATRNEEKNIGACLESVKDIADEIIIYDEKSTDATPQIAKKYGAKVVSVPHQENFHITKQKAIDAAGGEWILQMDADERLSKSLAREISEVIKMSNEEILSRKPKDLKKKKLFDRHTRVIKERDLKLGKDTGEVVAFFIPRLNYFVGSPLKYAGVYPDPAIRLIKKGKARLPAKSVHEIMDVDGQVAWLYNDMYHKDSPSIHRYLMRLNRYTDLQSDEMKHNKISKNHFVLFWYTAFKPAFVFVKLFFRHRGYMDGVRGFLWSAFSAMHFPIAYYKYYTKD